jgi:hypothetical protein
LIFLSPFHLAREKYFFAPIDTTFNHCRLFNSPPTTPKPAAIAFGDFFTFFHEVPPRFYVVPPRKNLPALNNQLTPVIEPRN